MLASTSHRGGGGASGADPSRWITPRERALTVERLLQDRPDGGLRVPRDGFPGLWCLCWPTRLSRGQPGPKTTKIPLEPTWWLDNINRSSPTSDATASITFECGFRQSASYVSTAQRAHSLSKTGPADSSDGGRAVGERRRATVGERDRRRSRPSPPGRHGTETQGHATTAACRDRPSTGAPLLRSAMRSFPGVAWSLSQAAMVGAIRIAAKCLAMPLSQTHDQICRCQSSRSSCRHGDLGEGKCVNVLVWDILVVDLVPRRRANIIRLFTAQPGTPAALRPLLTASASPKANGAFFVEHHIPASWTAVGAPPPPPEPSSESGSQATGLSSSLPPPRVAVLLAGRMQRSPPKRPTTRLVFLTSCRTATRCDVFAHAYRHTEPGTATYHAREASAV